MEKEMQLWDSILTTQEITCNNCNKTEVVYNVEDVSTACETFYKDGWRQRSLTYCPTCAKKKLKRLD